MFKKWRQLLDADNGMWYNNIDKVRTISSYDRQVHSMIDLSNFKLWLTESQSYSEKTIGNIVSRFKRADSMLPWFNDIVYQFRLEQLEEYQALSVNVRSQLKKAVKLYYEFANIPLNSGDKRKDTGMNALSLFANIGVAEAYLEQIGVHVVVANELIERRAVLYSKIYPQTQMICGDITTDAIKKRIIDESIEKKVDIIMATPPCQGMSTAGQQADDDIRNMLICPVIEIVKAVRPRYVFIENVPMFYNTEIMVNGERVLIPDYINRELGDKYIITRHIIDTKDYSVPQTRERAITLLSRFDEKEWVLPKKDEQIVTMRDAIGDIPPLDPFVTDVSDEELLEMFPHFYERKAEALKISQWHNPPHHIKRQVVAMQHTPTGCTAFDNPVFYPKKEDGTPVKGYHNTYKRQNWDTAAYTVTMDNRKISSQNNVHPGRLERIDEQGNKIYSDARTLTLYELMIIMSLPKDWPVPANTSEAFLRRIIGEGIPPLFVKKVFEGLCEVNKK